MEKGKDGFYAKYVKRILDFTLSLIALIVLSPLLLILTITGAIAMKGNPFFIQKRPGKIDPKTGRETTVRLIKLRTMTNETDPRTGELLPDAKRLTRYGKILRSTSLDEIFELCHGVTGTLSIVGPRPQLFRDLVFMTPEQRRRHTVTPGITGLAQVSGRNGISWDRKFEYDLQYIDKGITFVGDAKILFRTFVRVLKRDGITEEDSATATDFGDYLLRKGEVSKEEYDQKQAEALL